LTRLRAHILSALPLVLACATTAPQAERVAAPATPSPPAEPGSTQLAPAPKEFTVEPTPAAPAPKPPLPPPAKVTGTLTPGTWRYAVSMETGANKMAMETGVGDGSETTVWIDQKSRAVVRVSAKGPSFGGATVGAELIAEEKPAPAPENKPAGKAGKKAPKQ
jgi:hypothetical protein